MSVLECAIRGWLRLQLWMVLHECRVMPAFIAPAACENASGLYVPCRFSFNLGSTKAHPLHCALLRYPQHFPPEDNLLLCSHASALIQKFRVVDFPFGFGFKRNSQRHKPCAPCLRTLSKQIGQIALAHKYLPLSAVSFSFIELPSILLASRPRSSPSPYGVSSSI